MPAWGKDRFVLFKRNDVVDKSDNKIMSQLTIIGVLGYHIRLHWFYKDDGDWFHDHPRAFYTLCVCGSYLEKVWDGEQRVVKPGTVSVISPERAHSVVPLKKPCITVAFATPVVRKFKRWKNEKEQ